MQEQPERSTEAPSEVGNYQKVTTVEQTETASTDAEHQQLRTVSTSVTEGEVSLRYTPREENGARIPTITQV